jgi:hypothetical protein
MRFEVLTEMKMSTELWHRVIWQADTNVLEEHISSIFRAKDGCSMFLRNVGICLQVHMAFQQISLALHMKSLCSTVCILHLPSILNEALGSHGDEYEDDCVLDVAPCCLVEIDRRFRGAYCLYHQIATWHKIYIISVAFVLKISLRQGLYIYWRDYLYRVESVNM